MSVDIVKGKCPKCGWKTLVRSESETRSITFCGKCGFILEERRRARVE